PRHGRRGPARRRGPGGVAAARRRSRRGRGGPRGPSLGRVSAGAPPVTVPGSGAGPGGGERPADAAGAAPEPHGEPEPTASAHPELVAHLLRHAVRRGDFVLKSGKRSDWFLDAKQKIGSA